jgi:ribonuclease HI
MSDITINTDGGARGNPGPAAIGIVIRRGDKIIEVYKEKIGSSTSNIAEYRALIQGLMMALKHTNGDVECILDSELVAKQIKGEYSVRAEHLKPFYLTIKELERKFSKVTYKNVNREDQFQKMADKLVNQALDEK